MDEAKFAEVFDGFFEQLKSEADVPKLKLTLDGLKEWRSDLEPKSSATSTDDDGPTIVQLVHNVARPTRTEPASGRTD
ncbi:MAG: hypothetical protein ACRD5K_03050 [Candidatus Acidiferrales bacterium]